ncbi:DUF4297 domain-containing protein [Alkalicoccobacillus porphyridii]|uniref:DUF4297 domain-containing protein n=1 Tax=Alkalicoccobacillus porphyridii TaxID=2597270 RepID=A0A553ZVR6_9BACI|nr:DUF4297 domain-containing protein [Alkalicoccobacillus porphyridii]TSB45571.1 DUF4297 domain-containing protein [Alkalicoccobacillus porphyridii]
MELKELIINIKPREKSGSRSANRFAYQQDWVICKILELHKTNVNYLILLDYHDDVVVLNNEKEPDLMSFYQLKTKQPGTWSTTDLTRQSSGKYGKLPSILGKLYDCRLKFPNHTLSIHFVSNALFNVELNSLEEKGIDKRKICFNQLSSSEVEKVIKKIKQEFNLADNPDLIDMTFLEVSDLNVNDRETYVRGKLGVFLEELNPNGKFRVGLIYKSIFDEVKRKNNYEYDLDQFEDLIKHKSIGRSMFEHILSNVDIENKYEELWNMTERQLLAEGIPIRVRLNLRSSWDKYEIQKMDLSNQYLLFVKNKIKRTLEPYIEDTTILKLYQGILEPTYKKFLVTEPNCIYDEFFIKAIILMEYYGI